MPYSGEINTGGQVWVSTPYQSGPTSTGMIQGVWLNDGEDVEWIWTHTPQGSYVMGYTVRSKITPDTSNVFKNPADSEKSFVSFADNTEEKYYRIIGKHTGKVMGHCTESGKADVLKEEPEAIFEECPKKSNESSEDVL